MTSGSVVGVLVVLASIAVVNVHAERYDHLHLAVPDMAKAVDWYLANMDAQPRRADDLPNRVRFGETIYAFTQSADAKPSAGSAIDHIGFSVPNVDAKIRQLEAAGAKVLTPARDVPGFFRAGFVEDPWGLKLEILQDAQLVGLHHIHLRLPDPDAGLKYYVAMFGGVAGTLKGLNAVKFSNPELWLLADRDAAAPRSQGHAIDHLGWRTPDVETFIAGAKARGANVTAEPRVTPTNLKVAFVEDPSGVRIELVEKK